MSLALNPLVYELLLLLQIISIRVLGRCFGTFLYEVSDLSVDDYVTATVARHPTYIPHTAGRYQAKMFRNVRCPIVERLTSSLLMHGRNNGKKLMENS